MSRAPSRWYRTIRSHGDIHDFCDHIRLIFQADPDEREFPQSITYAGDAYLLAMIQYEADRRRRDAGFVGAMVGLFTGGNHLLSAATHLGGIFLRAYESSQNETLSNLRYIMSHYEYAFPGADTGSSLSVSYGNSYDDSNHWSKEPSLY